jgi:hypothetical protein
MAGPFNMRLSGFFLIFILFSTYASAQRLEYTITLKDHLFFPSQLTVPANKKIKLIFINLDDSIEEFDSFDLNREKVLFPNRKSSIYIGPLPKGKYNFFGEYHPNSARGSVLVIEEGTSHAN